MQFELIQNNQDNIFSCFLKNKELKEIKVVLYSKPPYFLLRGNHSLVGCLKKKKKDIVLIIFELKLHKAKIL